MSHLFEALQRLESDWAGAGSPPPADTAELLWCVKGNPAPNREAPSKGPGDDGHLSETPVRSPRPNPALIASAEPSSLGLSSGVQRKMAVLQTALPFVESLLLLFDGKQGKAVSGLSTQRQPPPPAVLLSPPVDLAPIKESLAKLKIQDRELRDQIAEQNTSVKRIEDHLDRVREATDRNTLEQQELIEDLKGAGHKATFISLIGLGLLAASVAINLALYLQLLPVHR